MAFDTRGNRIGGGPGIRSLLEYEQGFRDNPGRAPGGSGLTGIGRNDRAGYENMLQEQRDYMNLKAELEGEEPPSMRVLYGQSFNSPDELGPTFDPRYQGSAVHTAAPQVDQDGNPAGFDIQRRRRYLYGK